MLLARSLLFFLPLSFSFSQVRLGSERLLHEYSSLIAHKRIGLITNHTALLSNGTYLADTLLRLPTTTLAVLFGPEHGIRGAVPAGEHVAHGVDEKTGIPFYSLYGETRKPTPGMLEGVDVLVYDIQDVGARFFTYISTLALAMEAAAERRIPFIVLDRPNPIRGVLVEGFIREDSLRSFIGWMPIPITYGMTVGELAAMINGERWLGNGLRVDLTVIPMEGWTREMWYDETGLRWVSPSPNMKSLATATVYPGTCLTEGTNVSEGRGTERPFEYIGAPFVNGKELAERMNAYRLPGVVFEPIEFTPRDLAGVATNVKYRGIRCEGISVRVIDRNIFEPVATGVYLLSTLKQLYPARLEWRERAIDLLAGTPRLRAMIDRGALPQDIINAWSTDVQKFMRIRAKYLLY